MYQEASLTSIAIGKLFLSQQKVRLVQGKSHTSDKRVSFFLRIVNFAVLRDCHLIDEKVGLGSTHSLSLMRNMLSLNSIREDAKPSNQYIEVYWCSSAKNPQILKPKIDQL